MSVFTKFKNLFKKQPVNILSQERSIQASITRSPSNSSLNSATQNAFDALDYFKDEIQHNEKIRDSIVSLQSNTVKPHKLQNIDSNVQPKSILIQPTKENPHKLPVPLNQNSESIKLPKQNNVVSNAKPVFYPRPQQKKVTPILPRTTSTELPEQPEPEKHVRESGESASEKIPKESKKPIKVAPEKLLPEIYFQLLSVLRYSNQKSITERILKDSPFFERILSKCLRWSFNAKDAGEKFEIYNYLQLVQDFLDSDSPLAKNATISFEDDESKELRRLLNESQQKLPSIQKGSKTKKNIMIIKVPKNANIEEKIIPMLQINLIRDNENLTKMDENSQIFKIRIAVVISSKNNEGPAILIAVLNAKEQKEFNAIKADETFSIFVNPNIDASNSVMHGIQKVLSNSRLAEKVFFHPDKSVITEYCKKMIKEIEFMPFDTAKPFNQKQKEAIYAMTRPSVNTTFVLFGPPGSGKSYTIVEAIRQLLLPPSSSKAHIETRQSINQTSAQKILICTPSNLAADAIAETIVDRNFIDLNEVFRLMSSSRDAFSRNHKLDSITRTTVLLDTNNDAIRPVYDVPTSDVLKNYKVIICTLGSTPKLSRYLQPGHFSHIFVDEAAQASEMEIWLALGHLAAVETRLILAGDPMQLGPGTNVAALNKECYGFKTSLLLRLTEQNDVFRNPQYLIQLTDNHRSHHQIVKLSSRLFYFNKVIPINHCGSNSLCGLSFLRRGDFPIHFHHVSWGSEEISENKSRRNLAEVDVVTKYIQQCLQENVEEKDIGVIAPYKFQAEAIRFRLKNFPKITVETVERFQGSERRVIIISTVRTNNKMGFMGEQSRINTAITRAKHLLIIVGNASCLKNHFQWKGIIDFCAENRSFVTNFPKPYQ